MFEFINIVKTVMRVLRSRVSSREVAAGVCLALFLGFTPLNGPLALVYYVFFVIVSLSKISTLFALPFFKLLYVLGMARVADAFGSYLLIDLKSLSAFWRWLLGLPLLAYLDLNNTLVLGGSVLSLVLCVPVYFIAKKLNILFRGYLKARGSSVKWISWVTGFSAVPEVKKSFVVRRLNTRRVLIWILALAIFHFSFGFFMSPLLSSFVVDKISATTPAKITVAKVRVWPLTLSFSMDDLKVFDPQNTGERMIKMDRVSARVSPLALLAKRIVFSDIGVAGAQIFLEGTPDGSFNIQKLAKQEEKKTRLTLPAALDVFKKKKDLFSRVYDLLRKGLSKKAKEARKAQAKESRAVAREISYLPRGKRVAFKTLDDRALFTIRNFHITGATVTIKDEDGSTIDVDRAMIRLQSLTFDPSGGVTLGRAQIEGGVRKEGASVGKLEFFYAKSLDKGEPRLAVDVKLKDVQVDAVKFIFQKSLPVDVSGGRLDLDSTSRITGEVLDSKNNLSLKDAKFAATGGSTGPSFVPTPVLCDALNTLNPVTLKFDITGTVESPDFSGFQESLKGLVGPYLKNAGEQVKSQGIGFLNNLLKKQENPLGK